MKTKLHNRMLSALLALLMFLSCCPMPASSAEENVETTETTAATESAKIAEAAEAETVDYGGDVGKYAQLSAGDYTFFVCDGSDISEDTSLGFYYDEFTEGTILYITDWYWNADTTALWYQVEIYSGSVVEESAEYWPADPWILYDYTDETYDYDTALTFMTVCGVCGKPDCSVEHVLCDACGEYDCGKTHVWCDICGGYDCGVDHDATEPEKTTPSISDTFVDSNGVTQTVIVSGDALPEGAEVAVTDMTALVNPGEGVSILDISVHDDGTSWQPMPGETVNVSIPVTFATSDVNVFHFLEDPEIIRYALEAGIAQKYDVSAAVGDKNYHIMEDSVRAYQEAYNTSDQYIVFECFGDVKVVNGTATVASNGFSAYVLNGEVYKSVQPQFTQAYFIMDEPPTYYVRPGELIVGSGWSIHESFKIEYDPDGYVSFINNDDDAWLNAKSTYFTVSKDTPDGYEFQLRFGTLYYPCNFIVKSDIDLDNVSIYVLPETTSEYPVEPAVLGTYDGIGGYYLQADNLLDDERYVYTTKLSDLIDRNAVLHSASLVADEAYTVYGIVDTTGVQTRSYLTDEFDQIAPRILASYCSEKGLAEEDYKLVVYAVKYEAVGENLGWYINCKVEKKNSLVLSYQYNLPSGANALDHVTGIKPPDKSVYADENGAYSTTVDFADISYDYKQGDMEYSGTFLGWDTDPFATDPTYKSTNDAAANKIVLTENLTLYAIWSRKGEYYDADVRITKRVVDSDHSEVIGGDIAFDFEAEKFGGLAYDIYNADGIRQTSGTFGDSPTFSLKNGWYIIVRDVPNADTAYTVHEVIPSPHNAGYEVSEDLSIYVNSSTNQSGILSADFVNVVKRFTITFDADGGSLPENADESYSYTVEDSITLAVPTKPGYVFDGWKATNVEGNWVQDHIYTGAVSEMYGNVTLTAQWKLSVEIKVIVIGSGDAQQEIVVANGSDVLIAITPSSGKIDSVTLAYADGQPDKVTEGVGKGYIFAAADIEQNVTITIETTSPDILYVVGAIETGAVKLAYDINVVSTDSTPDSDESVAGKYLPYEKEYTITLISDNGTYIDSVNDNKLTKVTTNYLENATMNENNSVIATTAVGYVITFDTKSNDVIKVDSISALAGETVTLPVCPRWVDGVFEKWCYDADGNGAVAEAEKYEALAGFTMPANNVTMTAQWKPLSVLVGINVAYHQPNGTYIYEDLEKKEVNAYHTFPDEPLRLVVDARRAHIVDGTWVLNENWFESIPGKPSDYISQDIFDDDEYKTDYRGTGYEGLRDPDVYSNINTNGDRIKKYFSFGDEMKNQAAYNGIISAWLANGKNGGYSGTDIPWTELEGTDFKVVPYAIKLQNNGTWCVEMVILAETKYTLSYNLNMGEGYSGATEIPDQWYGENYKVEVADPGSITKTVGGITYTAKFRCWSDTKGKTYQAGEEIVMTQNLTLTAVWDYPLVISQTGMAAGDTAIYQIVDSSNNVILTVALTGTSKVIIERIPAGDYTIREITGWTWKYSDEKSGNVSITADGENEAEFSYTSSNPDWLGGEAHNENDFSKVTTTS